jgi:nitric-oxide synthase, bacterial
MRPRLEFDGPTRRRRRKITAGERIEEAVAFLELFARETSIPTNALEARRREVVRELRRFGHYDHTAEELAFGARVAWRNHANCIGRLYWKSLEVRDYRHIEHPDDMAPLIFDHMTDAMGDGRIKSIISIFPAARPTVSPTWIENRQIAQHAGYLRRNDRIVGDPLNIEFTRIVTALGWQEPQPQSEFDLLPLLIRGSDGRRYLYNIPESCISQIPIQHPRYEKFGDLGIKWYTVPCISDMTLTIGGIDYPCAPFNGWYMSTEIASRNLVDEFRYNRLPDVGHVLGLDMSDPIWQDEALVELNRAVIHSFREAGVTIVDHHTASSHYVDFMRTERMADRIPSGDWAWIVPPISPAACPTFHLEMTNLRDVPNFYSSRGVDGNMLHVSRATEHRGRIKQLADRWRREWRVWRRSPH